ncbi:MAG: AAA family ATPase [Chromatiaceae bacterium]|nr:AAA family ATPase [Chromatiaceae bacterium]
MRDDDETRAVETARGAHLARLLRRHGLTRRALAQGLGLAASTVTHWLNQGRRPAAARDETVRDWLLAQGVAPGVAAWETDATDAADEANRERPAAAWRPTWPQDQDPLAGPEATAGPASPARGAYHHITSEDPDMLLRRQPLHQAARRHFGLSCDPFARDLASHADVFESPDIRYVRESLWTTARHGGLLAVVGESGSGKTTLLDDIEDRIRREGAPLVLVRPDVTGMEATDTQGRVLRVGHIQEAIIHALAPDARLRQSPQARAQQLRAALIAARESGKAVCLAFDEAHAMPIATLKHLKRLLEIKHGFSRLLAILLLGQPELGLRLSERNPEVREVVQRCEVVTLDPLDDQLEAYLGHKLQAAGRALADLITPDGLDALRARLGITAAATGGGLGSRAYPLAAGNLFAAALGLAQAAGAPRITAAAVRAVRT